MIKKQPTKIPILGFGRWLPLAWRSIKIRRGIDHSSQLSGTVARLALRGERQEQAGSSTSRGLQREKYLTLHSSNFSAFLMSCTISKAEKGDKLKFSSELEKGKREFGVRPPR